MEKDDFKKCIGRTMESLELAGVENVQLKQAIKRHIWHLHDDLKLRIERNENEQTEYIDIH